MAISGAIELKLGKSVPNDRYLVSISVSEAAGRLDEVEARYDNKNGELDYLAKMHGAKFTATVKSTLGKERVITGDIVEVSFELADNGGYFITLRGISTLHRLKRVRRSMVHKQKKPEDVAKFIASENKLSAKVEGTSMAKMDIIQANETDSMFLKKLADMVNYTVRVDEGTLYFGRTKPGGGGDVTLDLEVDDCRAQVTHSLDGIVDMVTVIGHDPSKSSPKVEGKAKASDIRKISGGKSGVDLAKTFGSANLVIDSANIKDKSTATAWAKGELQRRAEKFVQGSLRGPLQPDAKAGGLLTLKNAPAGLAGAYLITEVVHTIEQSVAETEIQFCSDTLPK